MLISTSCVLCHLAKLFNSATLLITRTLPHPSFRLISGHQSTREEAPHLLLPLTHNKCLLSNNNWFLLLLLVSFIKFLSTETTTHRMRIVSIQYVSCESGHRDTKRQITKALGSFCDRTRQYQGHKRTAKNPPTSFCSRNNITRPPFSRHGSEHHQDEPNGGYDEGKEREKRLLCIIMSFHRPPDTSIKR